MAAEIPFRRDFAFRYGVAETISPLIRRVVANNPSPFTFKGTGTYIVGRGKVAIIDPGPDMAAHIAALLNAVGNETVTHILVTHTHLDHSPAAAAVKSATGSRTYGFGPHGSGRAEDRAGIESGVVEEGGDHDFTPDVAMREGDGVAGPGWNLDRGGNARPHLQPSLLLPCGGEDALFRRSRHGLVDQRHRAARRRHGGLSALAAQAFETRRHAVLADPRAFDPRAEETRGGFHRSPAGAHRWRSWRGSRRVTSPFRRSCTRVYAGLDPRLVPAAGRSVLAHLIELAERGLVLADGPPSLSSRYRLKP